MPPRLPSPASKLAFPTPNHIALQETNICAQLTRNFLSCERAVLSATSTKPTGAERIGVIGSTAAWGDDNARCTGRSNGLNGCTLVSVTSRISGAPVMSQSE
jgi:hypothetical protein